MVGLCGLPPIEQRIQEAGPSTPVATATLAQEGHGFIFRCAASR
jgi:hypothetical protein